MAETTTATDTNGDSPTFTCTSDVPVVGDMVSMMATDTSISVYGPSTSEFSENVVVTSNT